MPRLKLNNELGMTMLIAVIVTFLGTILAGSYLSMVNYESRNSVWQKHRAQSLFLAEAGIERGLYCLNNPENQPSDWMLDMDGELVTPLYASGSLAGGTYDIVLYDQSQASWLPANSYLIASTGTIPRMSEEDIVHKVSCVASKLKKLPIPGALSILDDADPEKELDKFESAVWTVDGQDMDDTGGLPGIAVANEDDVTDDIIGQLGVKIDQVTGSDEDDNFYQGADAILRDDSLPKNLDAYANYFKRIALDISSPDGNQYTIPDAVLGMDNDYQVLYGNLSQGDLKIAAQKTGHGILVLEGNGEFEMAGGSEWNGLIICASDSVIRLKGGGGTPSHIYGALLVANGIVEMNGTADIVYSSGRTNKAFSLLLYQVYSWCGGWGEPLDTQLYTSM
jgi:hypothetical protein